MATAAAVNTIYVFDTSALLDNPETINLVNGEVFIPASVIRQLDYLKNSSDIDRAKASRKASREIEKAILNGQATIYREYDFVDILDSPADNKIVGAAIKLNKECDNKLVFARFAGKPTFVKVVLFTTDRNMRIAARGYGIEGKMYIHEPINIPDNAFISQSVDFYNPIVKIMSYIGCLILGYVAVVLIFV